MSHLIESLSNLFIKIDYFCLQLLIKYRVDISIGDNDGMTPAMWACRLDHIDHYGLLSAHFNPNETDQDEFETDNSGRSWFHWSVRRTEPLECLKVMVLVIFFIVSRNIVYNLHNDKFGRWLLCCTKLHQQN